MDTKGFLQSTTIWGALLSLGATIAGLMGWAHLSQVLTDPSLIDIITALAGGVGGIMTIWGRKNATEPVSLVKPVVLK